MSKAANVNPPLPALFGCTQCTAGKTFLIDRDKSIGSCPSKFAQKLWSDMRILSSRFDRRSSGSCLTLI